MCPECWDSRRSRPNLRVSLEASPNLVRDFKPGQRVNYKPLHARDDPSKYEPGTVTSTNDRFVFVKYDDSHPTGPSQATDPYDLEPIKQ